MDLIIPGARLVDGWRVIAVVPQRVASWPWILIGRGRERGRISPFAAIRAITKTSETSK